MFLNQLGRNTAIPSLNLSPSFLPATPGVGDPHSRLRGVRPARAPGLRQDGRTLAPSPPRAALLEGRAGAGKGEHQANSRGLPGAGGFIVSFRPPPPAPRPQRHWKVARAARRRVIYRAGCARVTEPGPADWAADALGRGAESVGLRAGRRRQWASVCAAATAAAGGWGRGASGRSPTPLPLGRDPPKGNRPLLPPARTRASRAFFFSYCISKFPLPQAPLLPPPFPPHPNVTREGDLSGRRGRPLCAPRGAGPTPGAPSRGCGDRGAGSAGQVTYPGPRAGAGGFVWGEGRGAEGVVNAGLPFRDSSLLSFPPPSPARRKPIWVCCAKSERETSA